MESEAKVFTAGTIIALIIGLVVGFGAGAWWKARALSESAEGPAMMEDEGEVMEDGEEAMMEDDGESAPGVSGGGAAAPGVIVTTSDIAVADQEAGSMVTIDSVSLSARGWVAVREMSASGVLGNVLGAKRLEAGQHEEVVVKLLRQTLSGREYSVVLYRDNGDGIFSTKTDTLIQEAGGVLAASFMSL